jgi:hypothetical protein
MDNSAFYPHKSSMSITPKLREPEKKDYCDRVHLVRSVQRLEGGEDCFGRKYDSCGQWSTCPYRDFCGEVTQAAARGSSSLAH